MKAVIGWTSADLKAAARNLTGRPKEYWERPENRAEYEFNRRVIRQSAGFLRAVGHFKEPFVDWLGNKFWVDENGELVRWELAKGVETPDADGGRGGASIMERILLRR